MAFDFGMLDQNSKTRILELWRGMSESDKTHFVNQVALGMSIWGSDEFGRSLILEVMGRMTADGVSTLADFGLYLDGMTALGSNVDDKEKIIRAATVIEGYRVKHGLSSEPHRELKF